MTHLHHVFSVRESQGLLLAYVPGDAGGRIAALFVAMHDDPIWRRDVEYHGVIEREDAELTFQYELSAAH